MRDAALDSAYRERYVYKNLRLTRVGDPMADAAIAMGSSSNAIADSSRNSAPEITPAMIDAGLRAFRANDATDPSNQEIKDTVCEIFTAMSLGRFPYK